MSQTIELLHKAGDLGLLGLGVSEKYGGIEVSFNTTLRVIEEMAKTTEFSPAIGVQTSIGIAPILLLISCTFAKSLTFLRLLVSRFNSSIKKMDVFYCSFSHDDNRVYLSS